MGLLVGWTPAEAQLVLDEYIREGLANNIVLRQKNVSYEKALTSLRIAESYFLPSIGFQASYTSGEGGRNIAIPVGTLLNPVYQTLNRLTGSDAFPQISDVKEDFLPSKFYDAKIRTSMPLLNTDLIFGRHIQEQQARLGGYDVEVYKRELVKDITVAYFNVLSAENAVEIFNNALSNAREAVRVNKSLLQNGKGLPVYVLRSETETEAIEARKMETGHQLVQARRYFNFLLNRNPDSPIKTKVSDDDFEELLKGLTDSSASIAKREEMAMLREVVSINRSVVDLNRYSWVPRVSAFVDLGMQDQMPKSGPQSRYYLFGVQLEVPIFEAFRRDYRTTKAELDLSNAELELRSGQQRLELSASIAFDNLLDARQQYVSSRKQLETAIRYYEMVQRGYQEGMNLFIETIDARTQLLNASLSRNISKYRVQIAIAMYERETSRNRVTY